MNIPLLIKRLKRNKHLQSAIEDIISEYDKGDDLYSIAISEGLQKKYKIRNVCLKTESNSNDRIIAKWDVKSKSDKDSISSDWHHVAAKDIDSFKLLVKIVTDIANNFKLEITRFRMSDRLITVKFAHHLYLSVGDLPSGKTITLTSYIEKETELDLSNPNVFKELNHIKDLTLRLDAEFDKCRQF